jgi:hypothetical protein
MVTLADSILFTDHYQLTMAQLYHRMGMAERTAQFDHTFRSYPDYGTHQAGYCIAAGLGPLLDWTRSPPFAGFGHAPARRCLTTRSSAGCATSAGSGR